MLGKYPVLPQKSDQNSGHEVLKTFGVRFWVNGCNFFSPSPMHHTFEHGLAFFSCIVWSKNINDSYKVVLISTLSMDWAEEVLPDLGHPFIWGFFFCFLCCNLISLVVVEGHGGGGDAHEQGIVHHVLRAQPLRVLDEGIHDQGGTLGAHAEPPAGVDEVKVLENDAWFVQVCFTYSPPNFRSLQVISGSNIRLNQVENTIADKKIGFDTAIRYVNVV
mmetsp:Transcript_3124/g.5480  ORF Transcript_3124/g.5480 Transcript_3124/m.5480 type:complete len:218 (-) Transcript_3124:613-1266(-)